MGRKKRCAYMHEGDKHADGDGAANDAHAREPEDQRDAAHARNSTAGKK